MQDASPEMLSIFCGALERSSGDDRASYLQAACGENAELRARLEALLRAHDQAGGFLPEKSAASSAQETLASVESERSGTTIGPYKLVERIGEGGMGTVWMAQQSEPVRRLVAVKLIKSGLDSRQVIARFEAERQALALMDHPNIAKVLDARDEAGRPYFVMELVKGVPITRYCDEHHLTPRQRLELFVPVCQAIQHAHQKGIIHRDIKPNNVLVALYDDKPVPKIIDFGVAKATGQQLTEQTLNTGFGAVVGTLEYMSPEQAGFNQLDIDTRSDIYSLGVLLYELLSGSPPFQRKELEQAGLLEMLRVIREQEPSKPSTKLSSSAALPSLSASRGTDPARLTKLVRGELDWIVMKALEKDRARRYETANGFADDVQRYLNDEPVQACPPSAGYRLRKFARRHKAAIGVAGMVLFFMVLLGSGAGWTVRDRAAREAELVRDREARQAKVAGQVELSLQDVERLEKDQKWPEALAAAKRAEAALAGGEADPKLEEQVLQVVRDLEMVRRLEEIVLQNFEGLGEIEEVDQRYAIAFRQYGVDLDMLSVEDAAAQLRSRPAVTVALAQAVDTWAARQIATGKENRAKRLRALAAAIDSDSWRAKLRSAYAANDLEVLAKLAESPDTLRQPPMSLVLLGTYLIRGGPVTRTKYTNPLPEVLSSDDQIRKRRIEQAIALLERASDVYPDDFWIHYSLASDYDSLRRKHLEASIGHCIAARALRPRSAPVWNVLGGLLKDQGKPEEAIACYRKAVELDPYDPYGHFHLGVTFGTKGQVDEELACYRKAIEVDPKFAPAYSNLGLSLRTKGDLDEALAALRQAVALQPNESHHYGNLGICLHSKGRVDEAIAALKESIRLKPDNAIAHNNLGRVLADKGQYDDAIACFRQAIKMDPGYSQAHLGLGVVLALNTRDYAAAIAAFREAIRLYLGTNNDPDAFREAAEAASCLSSLASLLAACPDPKFRDAAQALEVAKKAVKFAPQSALSWQVLGWAHYRSGAWKASIDALEKSIELQKDGGDTGQWFCLAMAHWQLDQKAEAHKWYDRAVALMDKDQETLKKGRYVWEQMSGFRAEAAELLEIEKK